MKKSWLFTLSVIAVVLSMLLVACGPTPTPQPEATQAAPPPTEAAPPPTEAAPPTEQPTDTPV